MLSSARTSSARVLSTRLVAAVSRCLSPCGAAMQSREFHSSDSLWVATPKTTSFGFQTVLEDEKSKLVGDVFTRVASKYDIMNDLMSLGLHRLWKDRLVQELRPFPGMQHLDVAGGTGDVAFRLLRAIRKEEQRPGGFRPSDAQEETKVIVCDINPDMLEVGKKRAREQGLEEGGALVWLEGDAEALPLESDSVDGYSIAFGIRNVTHIDKALAEAHRVLKRGGRFVCLELSHVTSPGFRQLYDAYSFGVIPAMGEVVAGDRQSYQYLVESVRRFPVQEEFARMVRDAGFQRVQYSNVLGGIVAIHSGFKL
eukprot:TRINITY_DN11963_c0_g1_i1.p1 TRINITY_DN11963_c0_g1~~TRINITY_DN11963_c0_g1_i1.p1  ORF type:complete len:311 (+),score=61.03 TRINITY_DN11963_c0_g1_i1:253-1185(+)